MLISYLLVFWISLSGLFKDDVPEFKGGSKRLNDFVSQSLIYPEYSKQNCLQGTVQVSFRLTKSGKIFSSRIQKGFGLDLDDEALRIVRLTSGRWIVPPTFDTTQAIVIPINFSLKEYNCENSSPDDLKEAIASYKAREDLTKAIFNFYDKKNTSNYTASDEAKIHELKAQLGYDERFLNRLLKQAQQKLKQGDKDGACDDFTFIKRLGSDKAAKYISSSCQ